MITCAGEEEAPSSGSEPKKTGNEDEERERERDRGSKELDEWKEHVEMSVLEILKRAWKKKTKWSVLFPISACMLKS